MTNKLSNSLFGKYELADNIERRDIIQQLLLIFHTTDNFSERNTIAIFFADNEISAAIPAIYNSIMNPSLNGQVGSLIYALRCYTEIPANLLKQFIPLVLNGNFEVAHESYLLISENLSKVSTSIVTEIYHTLLEENKYNPANKNLICDLLQTLQTNIQRR